MRQRRREKSYGFFQPTYLAAQIASLSVSYLCTALAMYPIVLTEEIVATFQDKIGKDTLLERNETVWAYNIPYTFANEELKRYPVAKVSFFSKHCFGSISELSISLVSGLVAGVCAAAIGLLQMAIFTGVAALAACFIGVGILLGGLAILLRGLVVGPKNALNEAAELINSSFAI